MPPTIGRRVLVAQRYRTEVLVFNASKAVDAQKEPRGGFIELLVFWGESIS
ncbi:Uncharacterised protein [Mycobacteroides abscessus subsp. bolletii]|uniref:hypothetical protein n=1 Tax=Mycobacteroides abscessus TaxID=36809 RepID=UPI00092B1C7B|nr:hypothetical protein [Mycobacteroides abscessus]SIJ41389.1 Uncharacterised protein [Mycobacteroides abscessus subsp. bolletii]SLD51288.1 Uncharacterised protein [Mycobacteroides abscessus subsp. bolletii]SLE28844.1 Uncharacterised protein [Mycobacteroides abscessus subsp. bolletii]